MKKEERAAIVVIGKDEIEKQNRKRGSAENVIA